MDQTLPPRLPAKLESAVQRVRMAARSAAEHTVDSLGLAALATTGVMQRDALLGAQFELNRKLAIFAMTFNEALDIDVARQAGTLVPTAQPGGAAITPDSLVASWESLSLIDDHELELHISADRFALEISHACEWEIRELDAYMGTLMGLAAVDHGRNPLRAEVIGQAVIRAVEAVSDRPEVRKVLSTEIGRSLANAMRQTYADIVADLRHAGVRPAGLAVRGAAGRGHSVHGALGADPREAAPAPSGHGGLEQAAEHSAAALLRHAMAQLPSHQQDSHYRHELSAGGRLAVRPPGHGAASSAGPRPAGAAPDPAMGRVDAPMMALMRRLAQHAPAAEEGHDWHDDAAWDRPARSDFRQSGSGGPGFATSTGAESGGAGLRQQVAPNLILAYRDELRQHASGALDHMVIDVIASLFDQILSDAKVPPQMARQIARLQLPVLRAALGDNSFFSSRRHPVRRFINRIASLGTAVDDFDGDEGRSLLARVASLVQAVVDGDFDQIELYEQQLQALEEFITAQAQAAVRAAGAADAVLARKEAQLQLQQRFASELETALRGLPVPDYLRDFLAGTWSRAIASAAADEGADGALAQRLRGAGRELVMSVQPKGTPAQRQQFLRQLPQLMKDLNAGLDRIQCPDEERREFFAQLLPAHAESLKGQALSTLEHNLLARQVDGAMATPLPRAADLPPVTGHASAQTVAALQAIASPAVFSAAEAEAVGLVDEAAVDWKRAVDIDLGAEPEVTAGDVEIPGLPSPEPVEPTRGKSLADHVQIGFAYLMQLQGEWQKVRLAHVSAGRSFFVFTHGAKQRETVSMTHRMLVRLCEAGRLRAMESAYLLERATARARRQLAELSPKKR
ncbi:MAG: DUF1631 family protein [Burkholderiaceae bacterium]|nr:DUF1631 family protein [Burkholderiaceae bacterium]